MPWPNLSEQYIGRLTNFLETYWLALVNPYEPAPAPHQEQEVLLKFIWGHAQEADMSWLGEARQGKEWANKEGINAMNNWDSTHRGLCRLQLRIAASEQAGYWFIDSYFLWLMIVSGLLKPGQFQAALHMGWRKFSSTGGFLGQKSRVTGKVGNWPG